MGKINLNENDIFTGSLILVNPDFPMHNDAEMNLLSVNNTNITLQHKAALMLDRLMRKIYGWPEITPVSGFRSLAEQQKIWDDCLNESGIEFTEKFVAIPGHSEHQTGFAIDLGKTLKHIDFVRPEFPDDGVCGIFKKTAAKYGFILRYPLGKEHITKIAYEPWHFRYIGIPHAEIIQENRFVLEEYTEYIKQFKFGINPLIHQSKYEISYLPAGNYLLESGDIVDVSGNNCDGFIITKRGCRYE